MKQQRQSFSEYSRSMSMMGFTRKLQPRTQPEAVRVHPVVVVEIETPMPVKKKRAAPKKKVAV